MRDERSASESERSAHGSLREADLLLLDEAFERALASWEDGVSLSASELLPERPDLSEHAERVLALAQEIAVTGPAPGPLPAVPGYTILSELGRGGMGAVYLARQDRLGGRPVALKVLPAGAAVSSRARERFQAEANAIARLRHPHIVTVYDVVREGTLLAFAMEPIDGPSLLEVIDHLAALGRGPRADDVCSFLGVGSSALGEAPYWTIIARAGVAIARALEAVHGAGLLHRDVKPSNILLRRDGTPLLSDFGLVRDPESGLVTREGFIGTPAYASPEQLAGGVGATDVRSDVYALGATLYHALALRTPFAGHLPAEILALGECGPPSLRSLCPHVPRDLSTIIAKAMAPSARDRYATAADLADDLERLLSERPILARPAGVASRAVKLLRRNRQAFWGTVGGAIGVILLVGGLTMGFVLMPRWAREAREQAWLTLLDPRDTNFFANAGFWEIVGRGPPAVNRAVVSHALAGYVSATRWQPWDERTVLERDVLRAMLSIDEDGRSPPRFSESLLRRAPLACAWLERWTHAGATDAGPSVPPELLTPDELIALGLMSYVTADMNPAVAAWLRLETLGDPGPFVRAGLGLYFIYKQEPGRAYPRLEDADRAFRDVSFLRAAHAEAACGVGDVELAALLLEQARGLPLPDADQLQRVGTLVDLAQGNGEAALDRFARWYFVPGGRSPGVSGYQVGRWLAEHGDLGRAVSAMSLSAISRTPPKRVVRQFMPLAERWWDGLSEARRLALVENAITTRCAPVPWTEAHVLLAYAWLTQILGADPEYSDVRHLLHGHALAECGQRLEEYWPRGSPPNLAQLPLPPQGDELRRSARLVLGLETAPTPF